MINTKELLNKDVVKNYKEMCKLLNQEEKTGNSKKAQEKEWKRYFKWEKQGQKYIIEEIYENPLPVQDKRKNGNHNIYMQYIEVLLLSFLSQKKGYTYTLTQKRWWKELGMVNKKYGLNTEQEKERLKKINYSITDFEINSFYGRTHRKLTDIFTGALKSLRNRRLIDFSKETIMVDADGIYMLSDDNDKCNILEAEREVLQEFGYEKMIQVQLSFKTKSFYKRVYEILDEKYGIKYYFKQIRIIYTSTDIINALPILQEKLNKKLLNERIVDTLDKQAYQRYYKNFNGWNDNYLPFDYLQAQDILTQALIALSTDNDDLVVVKDLDLPPLSDADIEDINAIFG